MSAQTILTTSAIAILIIFTICFCIDLFHTLRHAWVNAAPKPVVIAMDEVTPTEPSIPTPRLTYATLKWVIQQPEEVGEVIDIFTLTRMRQPKPITKSELTIETLEQTPEAQALENWLTCSNSPVGKYDTPRPNYSKMKLKELRVEAKIRGLQSFSSLPKNVLVLMLQEA